MPKPACVKCQRFYHRKKIGVDVVETVASEYSAEPGWQEPQKWKPYKVWHADVWVCLGCNNEIVSGWAAAPLVMRHEDNFDKVVGKAEIRINDH